MKKIIYTLILTILFFTSCAKGWSIEDQNTYMENCMQFSNDQEEICECGLKKAMETYKTMQEAEKAIKNMSQEEVETFFADCM